MTASADQLVAQLRVKGIHHPAVLAAIQQVPRELFVDTPFTEQAYEDTPLPIGYSQTISQPYVVARMTELLLTHGATEKILEIGTGSGYQAAVLAACVKTLDTVERIKTLYEQAHQRFQELHLNNIRTHYGDGREGYPAHAPYDGIIVTAAAPDVPPALLAQLRDGGCLIMPVGKSDQQTLQIIIRQQDTYVVKMADAVRFVPLLPHAE